MTEPPAFRGFIQSCNFQKCSYFTSSDSIVHSYHLLFSRKFVEGFFMFYFFVMLLVLGWGNDCRTLDIFILSFNIVIKVIRADDMC